MGFDFELCLEAALEKVKRHPLHFQIRYDNIRIHFLERFPLASIFYSKKILSRYLAFTIPRGIQQTGLTD